jgi:hypothetical protein
MQMRSYAKIATNSFPKKVTVIAPPVRCAFLVGPC